MPNIIRAEHDKDHPYVPISNDTIKDNTLSFEERGFLIFLLSKPDDWRFRPNQLAEECGVHSATIYRLLKKLINAGYVKRFDVKVRGHGGCYGNAQASLYNVFESKKTAGLYTINIPF